jgi:branched-chain amino acid transport system permease protein
LLSTFLSQIANGLVLGSLIALIALGYTMVYGIITLINFAHGEIFMLGGFVGVAGSAMGAPWWAIVPGVLAICGALGLVVELVSFRKFRSADAQITAALSSLALGLIVIDLVQKSFGSEPVSLNLPVALRTASFDLFGLQVIWIKFLILVVTLLLMVGLHLLIGRTRMGRNIRAVADSATNASLLGISVKRVNQQTFFIASALAGAAGFLLALRTGFASSDIGFTFGIKALAIMAIGGMGDLRGAMAGGILVGVIEALAVHVGLGKLGEVVVWALMIFVLLARPGGLFGGGSTELRA